MSKNSLLIFILMTFLRSDLCAQTTIFFDGFESGELDELFWKSHPGEGGGIILVDSGIGSIDASSSGIMGVIMGKSSDGNHVVNALDLHLDLSRHDQVELSFKIKDFHDNTDTSDGIWFSDDGGQNFKLAFKFEVSRWLVLPGKKVSP